MLSTYGKNLLLGALPEKPWVQLHTGSPGTEGKSNKASEEARKQVSLAAAAEGERASSTTPKWTNVAASETYTHVSFWDSESDGNFLGSEALKEEKALTKGETFEIPTEELTITES